MTEDELITAMSNRMMDARWDGRYQDYCVAGAKAALEEIEAAGALVLFPIAMNELSAGQSYVDPLYGWCKLGNMFGADDRLVYVKLLE